MDCGCVVRFFYSDKWKWGKGRSNKRKGYLGNVGKGDLGKGKCNKRKWRIQDSVKGKKMSFEW